jgi:hypothetical protein
VATENRIQTVTEKLESDWRLLEKQLGVNLEESRKECLDASGQASNKAQIVERELQHCSQSQERLQKTLLETQYLIKEIKSEQNAKIVELHERICKTDALVAFTSNSTEISLKDKIKSLEDMVQTLFEGVNTIQRGMDEHARLPFTDRLEFSKSVHEEQYVYNFGQTNMVPQGIRVRVCFLLNIGMLRILIL